MRKFRDSERVVRNIFEDGFDGFALEDGSYGDILHITIDAAREPGTGFHAFRMAPDTTANAHEHLADEFFFVVEGDLTDHDGHRYRPGDIVHLKKGSRHSARTEHGCTLICYVDRFERMLDEGK